MPSRMLLMRFIPALAVVAVACAPALRGHGKRRSHTRSSDDDPCRGVRAPEVDAAAPDAAVLAADVAAAPDAAPDGAAFGVDMASGDAALDTASAGPERRPEPVVARPEPKRHRYTLPKGCAPPRRAFDCNPVTNEGCNSEDGEACDDNERGGFKCYPPPNDVDEGGECDDNAGPSCAGGMACDTGAAEKSKGICRTLCCGDGDCPAGLHCRAIDRVFGTLGFCRR